MKQSRYLGLIASFLVCLCLLSIDVSAQPDSSSIPSASEMEVWDKTQPFSFTISRPEEGGLLTLAPAPDTAEPGTSVFYLEYDPDDDDGHNKVKCYTSNSSGSKDDLSEGLVTLKADTVYSVIVRENILSLTQGETVLFTCVMPTDLIPAGGQSPSPSFAEAFSSCNRIGLGKWRQDLDRFSLSRNDLKAVPALSDANAPPSPSSAAESSSQASSAVSGSSSAASSSSQATSEGEPHTPPSSQSTGTSAGLLSELLRNPIVWVGAAGALFLLVLLTALLLRRRSRADRHASSERAVPAAPPAADNPYHNDRSSPPIDAPRFSKLADEVEQPKPTDAKELIRRMEEFNRGPSVLSDAPAKPAAPKPATAPPAGYQDAAHTPAPAGEPSVAGQLQALYTDSHARDCFNEEEAGLQFVDLDDTTSINLHYNQETPYRLVVSSRSYLATDFMVAGDRYLFLNYYLYNTQKNNYLFSETLLKVLHLDEAFAVTDPSGRAVDPAAALGRPISRIVPAEVRPHEGGYVLVGKGRIEVIL